MAFDPDAYLAAKTSGGFDPDAYLAQRGQNNRDIVPKVLGAVPKAILGSPGARMSMAMATNFPLAVNALADKVVGNAGQFITSGAGYFPNPVSDYLGRAANSGQEIINQKKQAVEEARQSLGAKPGATDWADIAGSVASPWNRLLMPAQGAGVGQNVASGMAMGGSTPVDTRNAQDPNASYLGQVALNTGLGGVVGGTLGSLGSAARTPEELRRIAQVQALQRYGVQPSIGESVGGGLQAMEEHATSMPIAGQIIKNAQVARPTAELNRGVYNDVLQHFDDTVPQHLAIGRPSVHYVNNVVDNAYDHTLAQMSLPRSAARVGLDEVLLDGTTLAADRQRQLGAWVQRINDAADHNGNIPGRDLKGLASDIRKEAFNLSSDESYDARALGQSMFDLHDALMRAVRITNPLRAPELANVDAAYTKLIRLNNAAGRAGATDGVFTPAQFGSAVMSGGGRRAAKASGTLPMQDISDAAQVVLKGKTANSATAERTWQAALAGAAMMHPMATALMLPKIGAGLGALTGIYSRGAQRTIGNALNGPQLADLLRQYAPGAAPHIINAARSATPYVTRGATALMQ